MVKYENAIINVLKDRGYTDTEATNEFEIIMDIFYSYLDEIGIEMAVRKLEDVFGFDESYVSCLI